MNIMEKLAAVQQELKAPKDKKNTFGGYNYRSLEGIFEAVKPLLAKYKVTITVSDTLKDIGGRVFIEATASMWDLEADAQMCVTRYAEVATEKKGMDASQITGAASSYAGKYAMNGLLLIDDTKDPDTDEYAKQTGAKKESFADPDGKISLETQNLIVHMAQDAKVDLKTIMTRPLDQLTNKQAGALIQSLKKRIHESIGG